jgi:hypothetical protein
MGEWTKGPWAVSTTRGGIAVVDRNGNTVGAAHRRLGGRREEQEANGALMAAAPDLAEALENSAALLEVVAEKAKERGDTTQWSMASVMAADARDALKKAKGEA